MNKLKYILGVVASACIVSLAVLGFIYLMMSFITWSWLQMPFWDLVRIGVGFGFLVGLVVAVPTSGDIYDN